MNAPLGTIPVLMLTVLILKEVSTALVEMDI